MIEEEIRELKEILLLNLKVNSMILTTLSNTNGFPFNSNVVLNLLKNIQEILNKKEKNNGTESA